METYDAVIIGAGNAGLTAGAALAQGGAKVVVLERHTIPGGCATSFCRGRFEFEVALHQLSGIGTPEKPGPLRMMLDQLGIMDRLEWIPMHDLYRIRLPGGLDIRLAPDRRQATETLKRRNGNRKLAARDLGINVSTLYRKIQASGVEIPTVDGRGHRTQ